MPIKVRRTSLLSALCAVYTGKTFKSEIECCLLSPSVTIPGLVKLHTIMIISPLEDDGTNSVCLAPGNSHLSHLSSKVHVMGGRNAIFQNLHSIGFLFK